MRNSRLGTLLLSLCVLGPASIAACHGKAEKEPSTSAPAASSSAAPLATNDNDEEDDEAEATPGGGGHKKHRRAAVEDGGAIGPVGKIVINQPGPTPREPPALRKSPSIPALPNLPAPSKYPKMAAPAKGSDTDECGQVWSGTEWVSVECIDADRHGHEARAAKVVIPYDKMKAPTEHLPKMVDHRADGTEGPVRKQGGPQCTAFAFTSALDHAYARWTGSPGAFSVMQVWARYHLLQEHAAADSNIGDSLSNDSEWPYNAAEANSWLRCSKTHKEERACGKPVDEEKLKALNAHPLAEITQIEVIPTSELEVLREKLAAGQDVTVAIKLPSFSTAGEAGAKYIVGVPPGSPAAKPKGGHQILLAGYAMTPNGNYYLVHNSWGTKWADEGFAWLHEDLLKTYWIDKMMVIPDVEPLRVAHHRDRAHGALTSACSDEKIPDSISGLCAGKCPDGSPRHNDVCGKASECPAGFINLTGECVLAAPKTAGVDTANKVKWSCGAGGCTYLVPKEKLGCKEGECGVSCPAPDFRLAETQKGLVCVE
jgi:C1A family cysteine protease